MPRRWRIFVPTFILAVVLDQVTKAYALATWPERTRIPVVENFWDWFVTYNTGSAFSLFASLGGARVMLSVVGVIAVIAVIWIVHKSEDDNASMLVAFGLMAGGAVGNLIDRIGTGRVTDFILWRYYEKTWPVFNIADVCLCVAAGLFLLSSIRASRAEKAKAKEAS